MRNTNSNYITQRNILLKAVLELGSNNFESLALQIFRFQAQYNPIYLSYINFLGVRISDITQLHQIPFLPISFFKRHRISCCEQQTPSITFESSGTTASATSRHELYDPVLYRTVSETIFETHYDKLSSFHILALLPSYLERNNSSLVYMVNHFIEKSGSAYAGFYLDDHQLLFNQLKLCLQDASRKTLLIGVTFALLDLAEKARPIVSEQDAQRLIIMETGGMKGRRKEMIREEVHQELTEGFGVNNIHSEYGMTELFSQGYSKGNGIFQSGYTMKILLRDINDPLTVFPDHKTYQGSGGINVIDLANIDSCSFIETQDLGRFCPEKDHFEVIGRFDNSDIRGCNLMVL